MKIIKCSIGPYPKNIFDNMPVVQVTLEDKTTKTLFEFYPDEIDFNESEFIGLTENEARQLKFKKDKQYLQS